MHLVVGLGNPGKKYEGTRHNIGFLVIDSLRNRIVTLRSADDKKYQSASFEYQKKHESEIFRVDELVLAKPHTFMNKSGNAVASLRRFYKISLYELYVVHDDLDIELGKFKIQMGKGPKVHNGLQSVYERLGSKNFWHVRVGIESRRGDRLRLSGEEFVLKNFSKEEQEVINRVKSDVVDEVVGKISYP